MTFPRKISKFARVVDGSTANLSSLNGGQIAGLRNKIINGDFRISQRTIPVSYSGGGASSAWAGDRWSWLINGTQNWIISLQANPVISGALPPDTTHFLRIAHTGLSGASYQNLLQRIEDVNTLAGKQVTLSFYAKADAARTISASLSQIFGTGGSTAVVTALGIFNLTTAWQRFTATVTLPSVSGKTLGTGSNLALVFDLPISGAHTLDFAMMQLEEGPVATPFEQRPIGLELALCQRYYETVSVTTVTQGGTVTGIAREVAYKTTKRAIPTVTRLGNWGTSGEAGTVVEVIGTQQFYIFNATNAVGGVFALNAEF
jgi:hypothetical protein